MMGLGSGEGGAAGGGMAGGALAGMAALDALTGGHAALAELNAQAALLAGLPSNLQQMVPPIAPLQVRTARGSALVWARGQQHAAAP
jgi:predicted lipid-binding transport protein (Tim44 family)